MRQRPGGIMFAVIVGLVVALLSYRWITDPAPRAQRQQQEQAVRQSRALLREIVASGPLEIVDPLAPDRQVGKTYIYPREDGWEVSGYYRRDDVDLWHPYLMLLDRELGLSRLKLSDRALLDRGDDRLEVLP